MMAYITRVQVMFHFAVQGQRCIWMIQEDSRPPGLTCPEGRRYW